MLIDIDILKQDGNFYDIKLIYPKLAGIDFSWFANKPDYRINSSIKSRTGFSYVDIYYFETTIPYKYCDDIVSEYTFKCVSENHLNNLKKALEYFNNTYEVLNGYFKYKGQKNVINVVEKDKTYMIEIDPSILITYDGRRLVNRAGIHTYTTISNRKNSLKIYNKELYLDIYDFKPFKSFIKKKNIDKETIKKIRMLNLMIILKSYKDFDCIKEI